MYRVNSTRLHASGLRLPTHLGINKEDRLFVSEVAGGCVRDITAPGDYGNSKGVHATGLDRPGGILPTLDGRLLVADTGGDKIYDITRGGDVRSLKPMTDRIRAPYALVEHSGNLITSNFEDGVVGLVKFSQACGGGATETMMRGFPCINAAEPFPTIESYGGAWAATVKGEKLLFCHSGLGTIFDVTWGGDFEELRRSRYAWGLEGPGGMITDPKDHDLYVTEKKTGTIRRIDSSGYARFSEPLVAGFSEPTCVRFSSDGAQAFVADRAWGSVYRLELEHVGEGSPVIPTPSSIPGTRPSSYVQWGGSRYRRRRY